MYLPIHSWLKYSISLNNGLLVTDNLKIMKYKQGHCWTKGKNLFLFNSVSHIVGQLGNVSCA